MALQSVRLVRRDRSCLCRSRRARDLDEKRVVKLTSEENFAVINSVVGNKDHAISILTRLLQVPYESTIYDTPVTTALLRLDPLWDPLRGNPAFDKLCRESNLRAIGIFSPN